jgi:hypothetical protein
MRAAFACLVALLAATAVAQPHQVFDPDDFVAPKLHDQPVLIVRLVSGAARNLIDGYRPLRDDAAFVHLATSLYWSSFQFDYKRTEVRGEHEPPKVFRCGCSPPVFFPTPPPAGEMPAPPPAGSRDTLQAGWYYTLPRTGRPPLPMRLRLTWSRQRIDTPIHAPGTREVVSRLSGDEQSFGLEGDTFLPFGARGHFGTLVYALTERRGTSADRRQREISYTARVPAISVRGLLLRSTLTAGNISGRGGSAINVIHPHLEAVWHHARSDVYLHVVWTPQLTNSSASGWQTHHQVAVFADRALFVHLFGAGPQS